MTIGADLKDLFAIDPSEYASYRQDVTESGGTYKVFVSDKQGGLQDIVKIHEALEHAGLVVNSKEPYAEYGIATSDGHTPLGYGDGKGGFYDRVQLSDNAAALAEIGKGFSFEVSFGNRDDSDVIAALSQAATFIASNRDQAVLKEAAQKRELTILAKRDSAYEAIAGELQSRAGRNDATDEAAVVTYINAQLQKLVPSSKIEVSAPEAARAIKYVYGLQAQERDIRITLAGEDSKTFRARSVGDASKFMSTLSNALSERLPLTRSEFATINGTEGGSVLTGSIVGSSAKLAAEISGELEAAISSDLAQPTGRYGSTEKPANRPA